MKLILLIIGIFCLFNSYSQTKTKEEALKEIRQFYSDKPYRNMRVNEDSVFRYKSLWNEAGIFTDLAEKEQEIKENGYAKMANRQTFISSITIIAFRRLWMIAETYRNKSQKLDDEDLKLLLTSICHYGNLENNRLNTNTRWHASCFAIPVASTHIYFSLFNLMEGVEQGKITDSLSIKTNKILREVSFQCWSVPRRNDETDKNIVNVERFRQHVWWVGGNATSYRPLLPTAAQLSSTEMADVVGEVAVRSISTVSQTTYNDDFWQEGITADGAGWGHGKQCLVWGYPIHGTDGSFIILETMKDYPLPISIEKEQMEVIRNFVRGSSYYYYKGYIPPVVSRGNMNRFETPYSRRKGNKVTDYRYPIPSAQITERVLKEYSDKMSEDMKDELNQFVQEAPLFNLGMEGRWKDHYYGSRYFFNNDDIIKKTDDYYVLVNMASNRVEGLESAYFAAAFNIFTCDGTTLFFRKGDEYQKVLGAFNLRTWPGITSRLSPEPLRRIENWRGYNSLHPFAAGATFGDKSFAGGFIFEKNNGASKEFNPKRDPNPSAFGVKAYKSYFMFDDMFLALGCGIENKMPEFEGDIVTTVEQTGLLKDFEEKNGYFRNNGIFYNVLKEHTTGEVVLDNGKKPTNWQKMCIENKLPETEEEMFYLYINHGYEIKDATYAYTVSFSDKAALQTPVIISNTTEVQAAESYDGKTLGAVFYETGKEIKYKNRYIKVSAPCALLWESDKKEVRISVTDALMNSELKEIIIETSIPVCGSNVEKRKGKVYEISIPMPTERYTGSPAILEGIQYK